MLLMAIRLSLRVSCLKDAFALDGVVRTGALGDTAISEAENHWYSPRWKPFRREENVCIAIGENFSNGQFSGKYLSCFAKFM